jgi:2-polyprenyl-3-methyl-5-hydroxy-6-metoxy-1,4-benzoquinol methylase
MTLRVDPEQNEVRALKSVTSWRDQRVLEVGCGDGRLTLRLARLGANVQAIDPDPNLIRQARKNLPEKFQANIRYKVGSSGELQYPDGSFDLVVFSWVL